MSESQTEMFSTVEVPAAVARALEHKPWVACSQWSETAVVIPRVKNALPGPWRNEVAPYLAEPMDTASLPWVREVVMCSGSQLGKTQWTHNYLGYRADRDPAPALVVMSDETMAGRIVSEKLRPMWRESPALATLTEGVPDALKQSEFNLNNGMSVHLAWSSSESKLASIPFSIVLLDEVEKYTDKSARHNARARTRWFRHTYKVLETSTPKTSDGLIWLALVECDEVRCYFAVCPHCGAPQRLRFDRQRVVWPEGVRDPRTIRKRQLARYVCEACAAQWTDLERDLAVRMGRWRPVHRETLSTDPQVRAEALAWPDPEPQERPHSVGFQISSLYSHFVSLSFVAAKFLAATQSASPKEGLQDLYNNELGEPFDDLVRAEAPQEAAVLGWRGELAAGVAPEWTTALAAGVDMQQVGFWFTVWAFEKSADLQTQRKALVDYGYLPDWESVEQLVYDRRFPVANRAGAELPLWRAALDTGGGKRKGALEADDWSRTAEAYNWLRQMNRTRGRHVVWGVKGQARNENQPRVRHSVQDKMPGHKGGLIPGGLVLWLVDSARFKDAIFAELDPARTCPNPQCGVESARALLAGNGGVCPACGGPVPGWAATVSLQADTGVDWARQMTAEEKQRQKDGSYEWVQVRRDNHYLDCSVYAWACAAPEWAGGVGVLRDPQTVQAAAEKDRPASPLAGRRLNPFAKGVSSGR